MSERRSSKTKNRATPFVREARLTHNQKNNGNGRVREMFTRVTHDGHILFQQHDTINAINLFAFEDGKDFLAQTRKQKQHHQNHHFKHQRHHVLSFFFVFTSQTSSNAKRTQQCKQTNKRQQHVQDELIKKTHGNTARALTEHGQKI